MDCEDFIEELASASPTPGGGGACAYCGALAAALSSMVCSLTIGKPKYVDVEDEVKGSLGRLAILRSRLLSLIDADAQAFKPLASAYSLPKSTDSEVLARNLAIQEASIDACRVPLEIMEACMDVLHECDFIAHNGSKMAISDAGASAIIAKSALLGASLNVYINLSSMEGMAEAAEFRCSADTMSADGCELADGIYNYVAASIGAPTIS